MPSSSSKAIRAERPRSRSTEQFTAVPYTRLLRSDPGHERRQIIVMSSILADELKRVYADFQDSIIEPVDGEPDATSST